ncbi:MAG: hypothetical protein K2Z80_28000 [Xanthobacteraceae bacterium]|nr:hypothetical protein [Xanthobacteraceae bacterium]
MKDLAPISLITTTPNLLAVANSVPAKTVQELTALARADAAKADRVRGHRRLGLHSI